MTENRSRWTIAIISFSVLVSWALFMVALYTELFVRQVFDDDGMWIGEDPAVQAAPYLFFAAVAVFSIAAIVSQRRAIAERVAVGPDVRLPRGAHRFATLAIVIGLGIGAVLGVSVFLEGFTDYGIRTDDLGVRFLSTYLPILLYTALLVTIILLAFVFRGDALPKSDDKALTESSGDETEGNTPQAKRDLGASYAVPIVATAIALIFGLIVYDVTGTSLQVWVWVIIQIVIGAGIVVGTIFAEKAVAAGPRGQTSRSRVTRGARALNLVLSIVFGGVVTAMGFGYGGSAVDELRISPSFYVDFLAAPGAKLYDMEVSASGWDLQEDSTVSVMIVEPERVVLTGEAGQYGDLYETAPLPQDLEPGDYTLEGEAVSVDGQLLSRTLDFSIGEDGSVSWDYKGVNYGPLEAEEARVVGPSGEWFIEDLAPALVLVLLAQAGIFFTLVERNRRRV